MLRLMRDYATSWMIKIILGAIVVVFVFWGVGSFRNRKANVIASVNGEAIGLEEYRKTYNSLLNQTRERFGNNLNEEIMKMLELDKQALDQLVNQRLLIQEAEKLQFRVSDQEVVDSIRSLGAFQNNGKFDSQLYRRVLAFNRLTPEQFEEIEKSRMLIDKLRSYIFNSLQVSEHEVQAYYQWQNTSVNVDYILFDPKSYQDLEPTEGEITTYFEEHQESYKTEPMIKAHYIHFDPDNYKESIQISADEVEAYYIDNKAKFKTPKTVEARHILIKVDANATEEDVDAAKERIQAILEKYKNGEDFAELAKQYSEGPTKTKGGDLGAFKKGDMVAPFSEKAFSMNPGEVSEPVRTRFGWHLIKVEKINAATTQSLEAAQDTITQTLKKEAAKGIAWDQAQDFYDSTLEGDDISVIGTESGLDVKLADLFTRKGPENGIANPRQFAAAAFELSIGQISEIQDLHDGYYIIQVIESVPGKIPELQTVIEDVKKDQIKKMQDSRAEADANELLAQLKDKGDDALKADVRQLIFKPTGFFKRNEKIPEIGWENEISQAAFSLSSVNPLSDNIIKSRQGYYIIRLKDRRLPDLSEFDKEKEALQEELLNRKRINAFNSWLAQVKERSDIELREGFLE